MNIGWNTELTFGFIALVLTGVISIFFLFTGNRSRIRNRRIFFLCVGFAGLAWILFKPTIQKKESKYNIGIDPKFSSTQGTRDFKQIFTSINDFLISGHTEEVDSVFLLGNQFDIKDLSLLKNFTLIHKAETLSEGFSNIFIPRYITEFSNWNLQGKIHSDSTLKVQIDGPLGEMYNPEVHEDGTFSINIPAPASGRYEYGLSTVVSNGDTIREILPIEVKEKVHINLLIISSFPQFEFNYLKNFYAPKDVSIAQRIQISKNDFTTSFVNLPNLNLSNLTEENLDIFDIIILGVRSWENLSGNERRGIISQVREKGKGLIIQPYEGQFYDNFLQRFTVQSTEEVLIDESSLPINNISSELYKNSYYLGEIEIGIWKREGLGKILLLGFEESYQLILNNQEETYQSIWSGIFSEVLWQNQGSFEIESPFLTIEKEFTNLFISKANYGDRFSKNSEGENLAINYAPFINGFAEFGTWHKKGWNRLQKLNSSSEAWYYAHPENAWQRMKEEMVVNYLSNYQKNSSEKTEAFYNDKVQLPWWIGLLITLLGFGLLWADERINGVL